MEETLRSRKKIGEKKRVTGSEFTTEREMLDAIKDANIEVGKEIIPILKPEVNK